MILSHSVIRLSFVLIILFSEWCEARKHHLQLQGDIRRYFPVSTFGFFTAGSLQVKVNNFKFHPNKMDESTVTEKFGFTLTRTLNNNISPYIEGHYNQYSCLLNNAVEYFSNNIGLVTFTMDFKDNRVKLQCNPQLNRLSIFKNFDNLSRAKRTVNDTESQDPQLVVKNEESHQEKQLPKKDPAESPNPPKKDPTESLNPPKKDPTESPPPVEVISTKNPCFLDSLVMNKSTDIFGEVSYSFQFQVYITDQQFEGLYALYFHNCLNYPSKVQELHQYVSVDLDMNIVEKNIDSFLSAGEIPLPQLYFALSVIFFILATIWLLSIKSRPNETFKIHYLMATLVFVKALSLLFHGINYHFIAKEGSQVETWAVLYYVTHFLKGALLIITIVLIGTGWTFIKHILSDKDKKIFMIVIPLQVLANIADIITEESEEGALIHTFWREIFILVDMLCCGAILFPIIWSIKHLSEASATDGKAAINLKKLQLFRYFYVMMVIYIYFTRIIVFLLKTTVPFKYEWLDAFFQHSATLVFFILTGYHFQPAASNPYYQLLQEDIEMDEEVLFIQPSTFSEAKKRNRDLETSDMQILISRTNSGPSVHDYD